MKKPRVCTSIQVDWELTRQRRADGIFKDSRSVIHHNGKEYLFGSDIENRRMEVYLRDKRRCVNCSAPLTFEEMEMDHREKNYGQKRHDNLDNLQTLCGPFKNGCHRGSANAKHK